MKADSMTKAPGFEIRDSEFSEFLSAMWIWASLEKDNASSGQDTNQVDGWICHIRRISRTSICEGADKIRWGINAAENLPEL